MDIKTIRETIYLFIETFVLCPICKLPELVYLPKKSNLNAKCCACSFKGELKPCRYGSAALKRFLILSVNNTEFKRSEQTRCRLDLLLEREEHERNQINNFS